MKDNIHRAPHRIFATEVKKKGLSMEDLVVQTGLSSFHIRELLRGANIVTSSDAETMARVTDIAAEDWIAAQESYITSLKNGTEDRTDSKNTHYHRFSVSDKDFAGKQPGVYGTLEGTLLDIEARKHFWPDAEEYPVNCDFSACIEIENLSQSFLLETEDAEGKLTFRDWRRMGPYLTMLSDFHKAFGTEGNNWKIKRGRLPNVLECITPHICTDGDYRSVFIICPGASSADIGALTPPINGYLLTDFGEIFGSIFRSGRESLPSTVRDMIARVCAEYAPWFDSLSFKNDILEMTISQQDLGFSVNQFCNIMSAIATLAEFVDVDMEARRG